jgi:hypothetical protein
MSKKYFIALADTIRGHQRRGETPFTQDQIDSLADFCKSQNSQFNRERWLGYIAGTCGPSGGAVPFGTMASGTIAWETIPVPNKLRRI